MKGTIQTKTWLLSAGLLLLGAGCFGGTQTAVPDGGIFQSANGGQTWQVKNAIPTAGGVATLSGTNIMTVVGDPHHDNTLYVGTASGGMLVSNDNAQSWRAFPSLALKTVRAAAVDPVEPCTLYSSIESRLLKSRDCGRVWSSIYEAPQTTQHVRHILIAPNNPNRVYAGLSDGVFVVSQNGGDSWSVVQRFGSTVRALQVDPHNPTRLFVVTEKKGLWRSTDSGSTWEQLRDPLKEFTGYLRGWTMSFDAATANTIWYASAYGLLRSADGGDSWQSVPLITAPGEARIYDVQVNPKNSAHVYYSAVASGKALLYKSDDNGANWKTIKLPSTRIPVSIHLGGDKGNILTLGMFALTK